MKTLLAIFCSISIFTAFAQLPKDIINQNCYDINNRQDRPMSLVELENSTYIAGSLRDVKNTKESLDDIFLIKVDTHGDLIWKKIYGGSGDDLVYSLIKDQDNFLYISGCGYSQDGDFINCEYYGGYDAFIMKLDTAGNIIWVKNYGGSMDEWGFSSIMASNGDIIVNGPTFSADHDVDLNYGYLDFWLCRINKENGDIMQSKVFGSTEPDIIFSLLETQEGGFFTAARAGASDGMVNGNYQGNGDMWLLKLDIYFNIEWQKLIGGSNYDAGGKDLIEVENGYVISGITQSYNGDVNGFDFPDTPNQDDIWVVRIDSIGNIIWNIALGGDEWEFDSRIFSNENGTYTVFGSTKSPNNGDVEGKHRLLYNNPNNINDDIWMVHLSEDGEILDQRCFGNASVTSIYRGIIKKSDYHYLLAGSAYARPANPEEPEVPTDGEVYSGYTSTSKDIWFFEIVDCNYFQPEIPANIEGEDSVCTLNTTESTYTTQIINPQYEDAEWQIMPGEAGELTNLQDSVIIQWNTSFEGQVELSVRSTSNCGESDYTQPKIIEVRSCVGIGEIWQRELKTYPNPAKTQITFELPAIKRESKLLIKDIFGMTLTELPITKGQTQLQWDCSQILNGFYFYQTEIDGINYSGKVLIK